MKKNNYLHEKKFATAVRWSLIHTLMKGQKSTFNYRKAAEQAMPKRVFTTGKTTWKAIRNTHQKDKESSFIVTQK